MKEKKKEKLYTSSYESNTFKAFDYVVNNNLDNLEHFCAYNPRPKINKDNFEKMIFYTLVSRDSSLKNILEDYVRNECKLKSFHISNFNSIYLNINLDNITDVEKTLELLDIFTPIYRQFGFPIDDHEIILYYFGLLGKGQYDKNTVKLFLRKYGVNVREFTLNTVDNSPDDIMFFLDHCPNLKRLSFSNASKLDQSCLFCLSNLENLETLEIYGDFKNDSMILRSMLNLKRLQLEYIESKNIKIIDLPRLDQIEICKNRKLKNIKIKGIQKLKNITLSYCDNLNDLSIDDPKKVDKIAVISCGKLEYNENLKEHIIYPCKESFPFDFV